MEQAKLAELQADKAREELETIDFGLTVAFDAQEIDDKLSRIEIATGLQQNFTYENLVDLMTYHGLEFTADQVEGVWDVMSDVGEELGILGIKR
jgi:hypothetical protein